MAWGFCLTAAVAILRSWRSGDMLAMAVPSCLTAASASSLSPRNSRGRKGNARPMAFTASRQKARSERSEGATCSRASPYSYLAALGWWDFTAARATRRSARISRGRNLMTSQSSCTAAMASSGSQTSSGAACRRHMPSPRTASSTTARSARAVGPANSSAEPVCWTAARTTERSSWSLSLTSSSAQPLCCTASSASSALSCRASAAKPRERPLCRTAARTTEASAFNGGAANLSA
mmetsp:Transcript_68964/g.213341  ORF Transcript_68964/g.213341 Transcript_68964/m.213341 type:complete len:236 (+) Transcript_68964:607-1314(+)